MAEFVLDAYPVVVYLKEQHGADEVRAMLKEAYRGEITLLMSLINWGEVIYSAIQTGGNEAGEIAEKFIASSPITLFIPDLDTTRQAAILKAMGGVSYADCFAAALAMKEKATLITGDKEFKRLEKKGLIKVKWI